MEKSEFGFLLGFFFGILGLLGLLSCTEKYEKDEFMSGWGKSLIISFIFVILVALVCCGNCAAYATYR